MIDTIVFNIYPSQKVIDIVKSRLKTQMVVDNETGVINHTFTKGKSRGSWDYDVRVTIKDQEWMCFPTEQIVHIHTKKGAVTKKGRKVHKITRKLYKTFPVSCDEFLEIEFSLPKWAYGVNFINTTLEHDYILLHCFKPWLEKIYGVSLPFFDKWFLKRIDIGENFYAYSKQYAQEYINSLKNLTYPRRGHPLTYKTSILWPGSVSSMKIYMKGPDFTEHDRKRLSKVVDEKEYLLRLQDLANPLLRNEVSIKKRRLKTLGIETVAALFKHDWSEEMKREQLRLFEGAHTTKAMHHKEVTDIIKNIDLTPYEIAADAVLAVWTTAVLHGMTEARKIFGQRKVHRAKKVFNDFNISLVGLIKEKDVDPEVKKIDLFHMRKVNEKEFDQYAAIMGLCGHNLTWFEDAA